MATPEPLKPSTLGESEANREFRMSRSLGIQRPLVSEQPGSEPVAEKTLGGSR